MKRVEKYLNVLFYCIYICLNKSDIVLINLNPFQLINKLPCQKRKYRKEGIDINKELERFNKDKRTGLNITGSGGFLIAILFCFWMALTLITKGVLNLGGTLGVVHFIILTLVSLIICYIFVFKHEKYLNYFIDFAGWSRIKKLKYGFSMFFLVLFIIGVWLWSFRF